MDKIYNISFTSRLNPIKPFTVPTREGKMYFSEVGIEKALNPKFIDIINRFILKNISAATEFKFYTKYRIGTLKERRMTERLFKQHLLEVFTNKEIKDNVTLLLAKDNKNRIQGVCLSYPYVDMNSIEDTLYIDSVAVNEKYRKAHIGTNLLRATIDANKDSFTDVFLTANLPGKNFFKNNGFSALDKKNKLQKFVLDFFDYGKDYIIPLMKPLQIHKPRWYEKFKPFLEYD